MSLCPHDRTPLETTGDSMAHGMPCRTCDGLWLPAPLVKATIGRVKQPLGTAPGKSATSLFCPDDESLLVALHHRGIEVDICSGCGGVWLDAGELKRLFETSSSARVRSDVLDEVGLHAAGGAAEATLHFIFEFLGELFSGV